MSTFQNRPSFTFVGRLHGHTDSINCLAVSEDGSFLASGGSDTMRLWNLISLRELRSPICPDYKVHRRGQVTCASWLPTRGRKMKTLIFTSALGYVQFWTEINNGGFREASTRVLGSESQILSLSVEPHDRSTFRIACGTYDQRIHVFTTDEHWELHSVYSVELQSCRPASVAFNGNGKGDILVFGRDDGVIYTLDGRNGKVTRRANMNPPACGYASIYPSGKTAIVDNTEDGFSIVSLSTGSLIRALHAKVERSWPKQVVWANHYRLVLGGSDHGSVYVYDAETARVIKILQHDKQGLVQTVTAFDGPIETLFLSASSAPGSHAAYISVWRMKPAERRLCLPQSWLGIVVLAQTVFLAIMAVCLQAYFVRSPGGLSVLIQGFTGSVDADKLVPSRNELDQQELHDVRTEIEQLRMLMAAMQEEGPK